MELNPLLENRFAPIVEAERKIINEWVCMFIAWIVNMNGVGANCFITFTDITSLGIRTKNFKIMIKRLLLSALSFTAPINDFTYGRTRYLIGS